MDHFYDLFKVFCRF